MRYCSPLGILDSHLREAALVAPFSQRAELASVSRVAALKVLTGLKMISIVDVDSLGVDGFQNDVGRTFLSARGVNISMWAL